MPPKSATDMPEDDKTRGGQTGAAKKPREAAKTKTEKREARLSEALRENLRRRKSTGKEVKDD